ncbi:MAG: OmpA family protein [Pseudomonadota bacterium]
MIRFKVAPIAVLTAALVLAGCESSGTPGLLGTTATFDFATASPEDIAAALESDGRVVVRGVLFDFDSATLTEDGLAAAARLGNALAINQTMRVAIVGHTDTTGDFNYNVGLSERRAEAMRGRVIESQNIAADRVVAVGVGPVAPAATNATDAGRAENRRVEVVLIN